MVRQVTTSLSGSQELTPVRSPEVTQVVARPVDQTVTPQASGLSQLVEALGQVQPGLNKYLQNEQEDQRKNDQLQGAKARYVQSDSNYALPPEASASFAMGYKKAHAKLMADDTDRRLKEEFEVHKNDPDFSPEAFVGRVVSEELAGVDDPDILGTYLPSFASSVDAYRDKYRAFQTDQVRENTDNLLMNQSRKLVEDAAPTGSITRDQLVALQQEGATLFKSRNEVNDSLLTYAQAYGDQGHPEIYSVFFEPDENGIAPVDNKEFGPKVLAAQARAQRQYASKIAEASAHSDLETIAAYDRRFAADDPTLTPEEIIADPRLDRGDKESYIKKAADLEFKLKLRDVARVELLGGQSRFGSLPPEHQKVYQDEFDRLGLDILAQAGNDYEARKGALGQILTLGTKNGLTYGPMKKLLSSVNTTVFPSDKVGEVPQQVLEAADYYAAIKEVNPAVAFEYTSESSKAFLDVFDHARKTGSTPQQAYAIAVRMGDPETQKVNAEFMSRNQKAIGKAVEASLKKVEGTGIVGFGKDPTRNIEAIKSYVFMELRNNPAIAQLGVEEATTLAIEKFKATHVQDGSGRYVFTGPGGATPDFSSAVGFHLQQLKDAQKARTGQEPQDYYLQPVPGTNDTYQLWDALGPLPQAPITRADMLDKYRMATSKRALQMEQEEPKIKEFVKHVVTATKTDPELAAQFDSMDGKVYSLFKQGGLSFREFTQYQANSKIQRFANWASKLGQKDAVKESSLGRGMAVDIPKVEMTAPTVSPKDGASAVNVALRYVSSDPHFALTTAVEGMSLTVYPDPAGGRAIGVGYNIDQQGEAKARKDLEAAQVPTLVIDKLLSKDLKIAASVAINPEQAARLYKRVQPQYEAIAKKPMGKDWDSLSANQKAALTYLAYNTGQAYPKALAAVQKGDLEGAAKEMTIHYTDTKTGEFKQNLRAMELVRSMFANPNRFEAQLKHMRGGKFNFAPAPDNYALR